MPFWIFPAFDCYLPIIHSSWPSRRWALMFLSSSSAATTASAKASLYFFYIL